MTMIGWVISGVGTLIAWALLLAVKGTYYFTVAALLFGGAPNIAEYTGPKITAWIFTAVLWAWAVVSFALAYRVSRR